VRQPLADMGGLAARTVLRLARGEPIETPRVELATELVVRESTTALLAEAGGKTAE
jgi:LacI family transcriptional regulator